MPDTRRQVRDAGCDPSALLGRQGSSSLFERIGDLVLTGPTLTNVNDFRAVMVLPS